MGAPCSSPLDNSLPLGTSPVGERRGRSDDMRNRWDEGSTEVSLPLAMLAITLASRCNRNPQPAPSSSAGRGRHLARDSASSGPAARRFRGGRVCVISSMTEAFLVVCSWPTTPEAKFVWLWGCNVFTLLYRIFLLSHLIGILYGLPEPAGQNFVLVRVCQWSLANDCHDVKTFNNIYR